MTDKEKIKAEVVRYKNDIIKDNEGTDYEMGFIAALESVETFISNMPEESASEDLEEYAESVSNYLTRNMPDNEARKAMVSVIKDSIGLGSNWQKQKTIDKAVDWLYQQQISVPNIDEFINDFKKYMED